MFLRDANISSPAFKMTFGQMSEVVFLLMLPWFFLRLGIKGVLLAGMSAWILRYAFFAIGAADAVTWMLILGIACMARATTSSTSPARCNRSESLPRHSSASAGPVCAGDVRHRPGPRHACRGWIFNAIMPEAGGAASLQQWQLFWVFPLAFAVIVTVMFAIGFREDAPSGSPVTVAAAH